MDTYSSSHNMIPPVWRGMAALLALLVLLALSPPLPARAEEWPEADAEPDCAGYLVLFPEDAAPPAPAEGELEPVAPGVYRTGDAELALALVEDGLAERAEPNYIVTLCDGGGAADESDPNWSYLAVGGDYANALGLDGSGVRVGIIDSGLQPDNPNLAGANIAEGYDFIRNTTDMTDDHGHGTQVAQVIAGAGVDYLNAAKKRVAGVTGVARGAELVPLRCFSGSTGSVDNIIRALNMAVDAFDCDVINMSFGMPGHSVSQALENAIGHAADAGTVLVASAGNVPAYPQGTVLYPAKYDQVIGVGSVAFDGTVAYHSQQTEAVYVSAPGQSIHFVSLDGSSVARNGTSFASPCVAGLAALLLQLAPGMKPGDMMALLKERAEDRGDPGWDSGYGYGFVSMAGLLAEPWYGPAEAEETRGLVGWSRRETGGILVAAAYDAQGRMTGCGLVPHGAGLVPWGMAWPEWYGAAAELRLFELGEDYTPLAPAETLQIEGPE